MSPYTKVTGLSPGRARALEMLRAGADAYDIGTALGLPAWLIRKWAGQAGIPQPQVPSKRRSAVGRKVAGKAKRCRLDLIRQRAEGGEEC